MKKEFSGTSDNGDFHEALAKAIAKAKLGLGPTDYVRRKLRDMRGENGVVVLLNKLTVRITARGPK